MKSVGPAVRELRSLASALREEVEPTPVGPVLVTGMLAEQLARQLAEGAAPGAVVVADTTRLPASSVLVHVMAGEPSAADDELVGQADAHGVPVILVQLWRQEDWTPPFVLTPFVVECSAGEGFPIPQIAARIVEAVENPVALARRAPVLEEKVAESVIGTSMVRAAILATMGKQSRTARPLITLEQIRMLVELRALQGAPTGSDALKSLAPVAAAALGAGFAFRGVARAAQRTLPLPFVGAAVAAAGTWALAEAFRRVGARLP